jgi:hypothetical protein
MPAVINIRPSQHSWLMSPTRLQTEARNGASVARGAGRPPCSEYAGKKEPTVGGSDGSFSSYFNEVLIEVNLLFRLVSRPLTTAMIARCDEAVLNGGRATFVGKELCEYLLHD